MKKPVIKNHFTQSECVHLDTTESPCNVEQQWKEQCDINRMVKQAIATGQLHHQEYDDVSFVKVPTIDYQEAMNLQIRANDAFASLPAEVRKRFGNTPENYLDFIADENNIEEMYELGIAKRPPVEEPSLSSQVAEGVKTAIAGNSNPKGNE